MKIAVLVSGGVDSSVALALLKAQGHDVTAFYLKIWLEDELAYLGDCPWEQDLAYARGVCEQLEVPLEVVPLQEAYWSKVVSYTIAEVKAGRTPSPDLMCNQLIKFGAFFDTLDPSFEKVATGHYAQVEEVDGRFVLKKAQDPVKDQTYFLSQLSQAQLARILFPIGHLPKADVRALAAEFNLPTQSRKDSQGICFLGKIKFSDFVKHHLGTKKGDLIEFETNQKIGEHEGFWYYTIGQRKGIGLSGGPWFVVSKDTDRNLVYISKCYYEPDKQRNSFEVHHFNWLSGKPADLTGLNLKLRHGELSYMCSVTFLDSHQTRALVVIDGQDQGIAPGQFAVFYQGDVCLGSATIC